MTTATRAPFEGKVAVVSGGGSGIGRAIAEAFLRAGAQVVICGRSHERLRSAMRELSSGAGTAGTRLEIKVCDMSRSQEVEQMVRWVVSRHGRLDVMANNAGSSATVPVLRITEEDFEEAFNNNLKTVVLGTRYAALAMRRGGSIINVASFAGILGVKGKGLYASAKAGVIAFTKVAASELSARNVRVNCVVPGVIETDMTRSEIHRHPKRILAPIALKRVGSAGDVAEGILYLASERAGYITGATLEITGGKFATQY